MKRMSCSITTTDSPESLILKIRSLACRVSCGFIPAVGSSSRMSFGSVASARAISSRRWSPYGMFRARCSEDLPSPTKSRSSWARARVAASSRRNLGPRSTEVRAPEEVRQYRPTITFSSAVMFANSRMFWNVRAIPARTTARGLGGNGTIVP